MFHSSSFLEEPPIKVEPIDELVEEEHDNQATSADFHGKVEPRESAIEEFRLRVSSICLVTM